MKNTKYESQFFNIAENFCFEFDDYGKYSFDRYEYELDSIIEKFQAEIIENCTKLLENERDFYLNRLKNRLHPIGLVWYFIDDKNDQLIEKDDGTLAEAKGQKIEFEQLIPFAKIRIENKGVCYSIEPDEAKQYFARMKHYKRLILHIITKITTDQNKTEDDCTPDHTELFKALSTYITGINAIGFSHIIEHHSLPLDGTPRANWTKSDADARRFGTFIKIKLTAFNKCFSMPEGKKLDHSIKDETFSEITAILKDYFKK